MVFWSFGLSWISNLKVIPLYGLKIAPFNKLIAGNSLHLGSIAYCCSFRLIVATIERLRADWIIVVSLDLPVLNSDGSGAVYFLYFLYLSVGNNFSFLVKEPC